MAFPEFGHIGPRSEVRRRPSKQWPQDRGFWQLPPSRRSQVAPHLPGSKPGFPRWIRMVTIRVEMDWWRVRWQAQGPGNDPPEHGSCHDSPDTSVRFLQTVKRPTRSAAKTSCGMCAVANNRATWNNNPASRGFSRTDLKCSDVMPGGPAAAPRRTHFRFFMKRSTSKQALTLPRGSQMPQTEGTWRGGSSCKVSQLV